MFYICNSLIMPKKSQINEYSDGCSRGTVEFWGFEAQQE